MRSMPPSRFQFKPGQSGNPLGRSLSLAKQARELTKNGRECLELLAQWMRDPKLSVRDRITCAMHLLERAFGKVMSEETVAAMDERLSLDASGLTEAERGQLIGLLEKLGVDVGRGEAAEEAQSNPPRDEPLQPPQADPKTA